MDASAAVCLIFGNQAFQDTVDETSLQDVLTQTAELNPRLMLNLQPNLTTIRDCPNLLQLNNMLVEESTRIHSILTTQEDRNQERLLKKRALQRDIESLKHEINDTPEQDLIVGVLKDFLDQLQELKKRRSQIQTMDSQELVMANIQDEDGGSTVATFSVPEWLIQEEITPLEEGDIGDPE